VARRRRTWPAIAAVAVALLLAAGCASPGGPAPSTNGIGPITLAIGKDNSGWLQGVITNWNQRYPNQKVTLLPAGVVLADGQGDRADPVGRRGRAAR
jgi:multiple sugar transport system substrate-binding protein